MEGASPLHVEYLGQEPRPGLPTFVMLHGFGASSYTWRHWTPALERRGRVVLVDLKGFGSSSKPDDGKYRPSNQVALIERLVDAAGADRVTLIGHSYGGGIALLTALSMAERNDPRLARLVVVAGAAYPQRLPPFVKLARIPRITTAALSVIGPERVLDVALRSIVWDPGMVDADQIEAYSAPLRAPDGVRAMLEAAREIVPDDIDDLTSRYPRIAVPTLLLWGHDDRVVPLSIGRRLSGALPRARLHVMEECGHVPQEERPQASLALLEAFLNET